MAYRSRRSKNLKPFLTRHTLPVLVVALATLAGPARALATFQDVQNDFRSSETRILNCDCDGVLLQRVRTDATARRGRSTALSDISPALRNAMLLSEDKRFYEHSGIDWRAAAA